MMKRVERDDRVKEYFISERFVQSEDWKKEISRNKRYPKEIRRYRYTRDYVKYSGNKYYPKITKSLRFSEIIHATSQNALFKILNDGGFRPGRKKIPGCTLDTFVWFGMKIGLPEVDALKDSYRKQCMMEDLRNERFCTDYSAAVDCSSIVNSPCFEPMSRYGEFKLTFEIRNVINAYWQQFCPQTYFDLGPNPEYRVLGTFIYKMEIMHTVLVCPPNTPGTDKYPLLDRKQTSVIYENSKKGGIFIWSPDSTGDKDNADKHHKKRGPFRRWEHVTFAFYVPDGIIFKLDNLSSHISVCIYMNPRKRYQESLINDTIQTFLDKVSEVPTIETKRELVNLLVRSVRGYLNEEKVFEKMNILYTYQPVDLDTIIDRVEELLDSEEFDWSPLIEWMKDVQQTKNTAVLSSILNYLKKKTEICIATLKINDE